MRFRNTTKYGDMVVCHRPIGLFLTRPWHLSRAVQSRKRPTLDKHQGRVFFILWVRCHQPTHIRANLRLAKTASQNSYELAKNITPMMGVKSKSNPFLFGWCFIFTSGGKHFLLCYLLIGFKYALSKCHQWQ